ncbi:hypothetical protein [Corynebacterium sp. HMSC077B05]|uniref:hypothetical protein n=1 Tax=Corynebacterium sp. HMSC077B05 TaxID=1739252 RepID=UPI00143B9A31|nr:hypothetical protein [Corynebacterium sp. HMSC077B05]
MEKNSNDSDIFTRERRKKWFGRPRTHYGKASTILTAASGACGAGAAGLPLIFPDFVGAVSAVLAPVLAAGAWALRNAEKDKLDARSKTDFDGLVRAIDKSHSGLSDAASVSPDDRLAKIYIETVLEELRTLLEPDGKDNCVRVCLYRKDSAERKEEADGDPRVEQGINSGKEDEATVSFTRYVFQRGSRTDQPRWSFDSTTAPGSVFFAELFRRGRYDCKSRVELKAIGKDRHYQGKVAQPAYASFVNIALTDADNETFAMLTCDSVKEHFFDERRNRIIKAFIPLLKLALQDGATHVPEPKSKRDQVELGKRRKPIRPSKPKDRIVQAEKQGDDHDA